MSYLDDNPDAVKNAGYYRRQLKAVEQQLATVTAELHDWKLAWKEKNDEVIKLRSESEPVDMQLAFKYILDLIDLDTFGSTTPEVTRQLRLHIAKLRPLYLRPQAQKSAKPVGLFDQYGKHTDGSKLYRQVWEDGTNEGANLVSLFERPQAEGKVLVPIEPTVTQLEAGMAVVIDGNKRCELAVTTVRKCYEAMLLAKEKP